MYKLTIVMYHYVRPIKNSEYPGIKGLEYFQSVIDKDYVVMNYPYGGYNEDVLDYVSKIGCKLGFSVEARHADLSKDNPLILPRLDTNDFPPKSEQWKHM